MLNKMGYAVDVVGNGALAVQAVKINTQRDGQMPTMSGYGPRKIRAAEWAEMSACRSSPSRPTRCRATGSAAWRQNG